MSCLWLYMVKANVFRKKEWTEEDLQKALNKHWALEPHDRHQAVSRIAVSCGVPHQTLDNCIKGKNISARESQVPKQILSGPRSRTKIWPLSLLSRFNLHLLPHWLMLVTLILLFNCHITPLFRFSPDSPHSSYNNTQVILMPIPYILYQ